MKFVIEIDTASGVRQAIASVFASALRQLLSERHHIVVVYPLSTEQCVGVVHHKPALVETEEPALRTISGRLVAALKAAGISAIGLYGADGDCIRLRLTREKAASVNYIWEAAAVNPFWLDVIAIHGGVPVICNIALGPDSQYHTVCADRLAAVCATAWHADALIFFTAEDGIRNNNGSVMRWLEVAEPDTLLPYLATNRHLHSKLNACYEALNCGVHRARILPISKIYTLSVFCSERIDFGTEVIMGACAAKA